MILEFLFFFDESISVEYTSLVHVDGEVLTILICYSTMNLSLFDEKKVNTTNAPEGRGKKDRILRLDFLEELEISWI